MSAASDVSVVAQAGADKVSGAWECKRHTKRPARTERFVWRLCMCRTLTRSREGARRVNRLRPLAHEGLRSQQEVWMGGRRQWGRKRTSAVVQRGRHKWNLRAGIP